MNNLIILLIIAWISKALHSAAKTEDALEEIGVCSSCGGAGGRSVMLCIDGLDYDQCTKCNGTGHSKSKYVCTNKQRNERKMK